MGVVMKLTTRGDYAARVLLELSTREGQDPLSAHELAARTGVSVKYLEQIMARLRNGHIVRSYRGAHGGYELARDAETLSVGEVVRMMDGPLAPSPCASQSAHVPCPAYRCPSEASCALRGLWTDVRDAVAEVLDNTSFADLVQRHREGQTVARYSI
jgi:Rrf2 family protein